MTLQSEHFRGNNRLAAAANNNPPLKTGDDGDAVVRLEAALIDVGYAFPVSTAKSGQPDGIYGSETRSRIIAFQGDQQPKLSTDGQAGTNTLAGLDALLLERRLPYGADEEDEKVDISSVFRILGKPKPESLPPWVDWNPKSYRAAVRHQIQSKLIASKVGRAVIGAISGSIAIKPAPNARDGDAFFKPVERTVYYIPGNFISSSKLFVGSPNFVGFTADAVLLHELVHAMRFTKGFRVHDNEDISAIRYPPGLPPTFNSKAHLFFGNRGEFNAIVVANTYRSEIHPGLSLSGMSRNFLMLRKDHHSGHIHIPLAAPEKFHLHNKIKHYLNMFWREQPDFCRAIASSPAAFNPLREVKKLA